jgi:hypothetical protein
MDAAKTLVSSFRFLDYCNSLLAGITSGLLMKLQSVSECFRTICHDVLEI